VPDCAHFDVLAKTISCVAGVHGQFIRAHRRSVKGQERKFGFLIVLSVELCPTAEWTAQQSSAALGIDGRPDF
jgi:hypothetical protein